MSTAWLQRPPSNPPLNDTSTVDYDLTRIRAEPPPDVEANKLDAIDHVEELPIARLMRSHSRPPASPTKSPRSESPADAPLLPIVVLTSDSTFASQLRAALDALRDVQIVDTEDSAAELAAAGRCPILVTDNVMPRSAFATLSARLRAHDPSTAIIVSGNRDQGSSFIGLQSAGVVDGFLLKPVTAAATQLVLEAATRRHRNPASIDSTHRSRHPTRSKASMPDAKPAVDVSETIEARVRPTMQLDPVPAIKNEAAVPPRSLMRMPWSLVAVIGIIVAGVAWWLTTQRGIDATELAAKHLALADDAYAAGRLVDPRDGAVRHYQTVLAVDPQNLAAHRGIDRVAAELSRTTQAHMAQQNLPEAALILQRLRELQPDYPELPLLESQLQSLQNAVVASHTAATPPPEPVAAKPALGAAPSRTAPRRPAPAQGPKAPDSNAQASGTTEQLKRSSELASATPPLTPSSPAVPSTAITKPEPAISATATETPLSEQPSDTSQPTQLASAPSAALPVSPPIIASTPPTGAADIQPPTASIARELVRYVPPTYPSAAFARGMEGWVQVGMEITPAGDVINAHIEAGEKRQLFGRAALAAVSQWKYAPNANRTAAEPLSVRLEFKMESRR